MAWYWIILFAAINGGIGFLLGAAWAGLCRANDQFDKHMEDRHA